MNRLTDEDRELGPITYGRSSWRPLRLVWSSGGGEDDDGEVRNTLTVYALGWVARVCLPNVLRPFKIKHVVTTWDEETVARLGRSWYYETHPREYGFCLHEGFLQVFFGPQTRDSDTTCSWSKHLSWTQWRHVRFSLYGLEGEHFWTQLDADRERGPCKFDAQMEAERACPAASFLVRDFDGESVIATTRIHEREWRLGEGWFKWLSLFKKPMVRRSLDIEFSTGVGPGKGSWKGGTVGTSIDVLPGELHESAFRRYCAQDHRSKYRPYYIEFVERLT